MSSSIESIVVIPSEDAYVFWFGVFLVRKPFKTGTNWRKGSGATPWAAQDL
jgi:hypothetical protein